MLSRIAARTGRANAAIDSVSAENAGSTSSWVSAENIASAGSWENQEAEEMARGLAAWRKVQERRRLQAVRSGDEGSLWSLFLLTSAVCSLAFFVFDFVNWDCS